MANQLEQLVSAAESTLRTLQNADRNEFVKNPILSEVYSIHAHGRLLLRGIDRDIYRTYCDLFSKSIPDHYAWTTWNAYLLDQFQRCVGILKMVQKAGPEVARDRTAAKVFISHGKFGPAFTKLETFIHAIGCLPVYDVDEPTAGRTINQHVQHLFEVSDFYVILASAETTRADGTKLPNHNVTIELDRLQRDKIDRMLLLVEDGCAMPSMLQDVIRASFTAECMDQGFTKLAAELTRLGLR